MRILLDENLSKVALRQLAAAQHDVRRVARAIGGLRDEHVLELARGEQRLLVTFDVDFIDLVYVERLSAPPGVILLRMNLPKTLQAPTIAGIIDSHEVMGFFTVVTEDQVQATPLPDSP